MFDIGFAELIIIGVVALLVIGPERLPSTIRTASLWLNRIRRGFNDIKREVEQELHNDAVMQELRETGAQLQHETQSIGEDLRRETALDNHIDAGGEGGAVNNAATDTDAEEGDTAQKRAGE